MLKQKEVHPYGREKLITHELELQISYDFYVYASAYTEKVFYDLENTLLRNGEKYIQQKSILHSDNGGYLFFDIIVWSLLLFYHGYIWDSIEILTNVSHMTLEKTSQKLKVFARCPVLHEKSS